MPEMFKYDPDFSQAAEQVDRATTQEIVAFVERVERLNAEREELAGLIKEIWAEAKGRGYDTDTLKKIIRLRAKDPDKLAEEDALLGMYREAVGV